MKDLGTNHLNGLYFHFADPLHVMQAIELLTRNADMPVREKELIKGIPEQETISAIIGSIKISMPGLQKFKSQMKSEKKKGRR